MLSEGQEAIDSAVQFAANYYAGEDSKFKELLRRELVEIGRLRKELEQLGAKEFRTPQEESRMQSLADTLLEIGTAFMYHDHACVNRFRAMVERVASLLDMAFPGGATLATPEGFAQGFASKYKRTLLALAIQTELSGITNPAPLWQAEDGVFIGYLTASLLGIPAPLNGIKPVHFLGTFAPDPLQGAMVKAVQTYDPSKMKEMAADMFNSLPDGTRVGLRYDAGNYPITFGDFCAFNGLDPATTRQSEMAKLNVLREARIKEAEGEEKNPEEAGKAVDELYAPIRGWLNDGPPMGTADLISRCAADSDCILLAEQIDTEFESILLPAILTRHGILTSSDAPAVEAP
jgi:hypothetical protein